MPEKNLQAENMLRRHLVNPFLVLSLEPDATIDQVERQGQKLLLMLSAGISESACYDTPLGRRVLTEEMVREAIAELRDPDRRLVHEWWTCRWRNP
jgi:hypothetical protein